jgi:hypothetical protein
MRAGGRKKLACHFNRRWWKWSRPRLREGSGAHTAGAFLPSLTGLRSTERLAPAINRWAIFFRPLGYFHSADMLFPFGRRADGVLGSSKFRWPLVDHYFSEFAQWGKCQEGRAD